MRKTQNSTAPLIEAFASLSRKAAGSQGSALSRPSQRAESPFDSRCPTRESIKQKTIALRRARNTLCAPGALMEESVPRGRFPLYRYFVSSARSYGVRMYFVPHRGQGWVRDFASHRGRGYGKPIRQVGLHERPLAAGALRGCGRAFYFWFGSFSPGRK